MEGTPLAGPAKRGIQGRMTGENDRTLLSIGHGYSATAATAALPPGWRILATTRREDRAARLAAQGLEPVLWSAGGAEAGLLAAAAAASHLLISVPPGARGDPALAVLAQARLPGLRWLGYLSAASVYGDRGGEWVDDDSPPAPTGARGLARLEAESGWQALAARHAAGAALFRIAGIYGPGRSAFDALAEGRARRVVKPGQTFNRIHVHDLGALIAAALLRGATGPVIASDLEPAPPQDVIAHACALLGRDPPPEIPFHAADLSPMSRSFYAENKRLRPGRLEELGVTLAYPSYREGLAALKP